MSVENLKEYAVRCASEPALRERAKEIGLENLGEHIREAERMGLDWNMGDMLAFRKELIDADDDLSDLSEDELELISGGVLSVTATVAVAVGVGVGVGVGAVAGGAAAGAGAATAAGKGGW